MFNDVTQMHDIIHIMHINDVFQSISNNFKKKSIIFPRVILFWGLFLLCHLNFELLIIHFSCLTMVFDNKKIIIKTVYLLLNDGKFSNVLQILNVAMF